MKLDCASSGLFVDSITEHSRCMMPNMPFHLTPASLCTVARSGAGERRRWASTSSRLHKHRDGSPAGAKLEPSHNNQGKVIRVGVINTSYRSAVGVALAAAFILVWLSLGVGIIGKDGDPANLMYFAVLAVGIIGAIIARFQPHGMARALFATALAQALVTVIALTAGLGLPWSGPAEILGLNGFFVAMFVGSAWLFRRSARERLEQGGA